jgi:arsenite oxidase small subunit
MRIHVMPFTAKLLSAALISHLLYVYARLRRRDGENRSPRSYVCSCVVRKPELSNEGGIVERAISRERFIRLGAALGVGAASASVLAACGGGSSGGESGGDSGNDGSGGGGGGEYNARSGGSKTKTAKPSKEPSAKKTGGAEKQAPGGKAIARASEVQPGSAVKFKDAGNPAVLVHLPSGDFVAYSAICTHQGCTVAYRNGQLACPCHGSVFDPANNGQVVTPPAQQPLPEIPVEVKGGEVFKA